MDKPRVFVSYDHSEDAYWKYLLLAWDANPDFDSRGPGVAIDSTTNLGASGRGVWPHARPAATVG